MKTYKFEISSKNNSTIIIIEGVLALQNSNDIKDEFIESLKHNTNFELIIQNVSSIDLSFFQLLESFKKSVKNNKKNISIRYLLSEEHQTLINKTNLIIC